MEIILNGEKKHCPKCFNFMQPTIYADPELDPKELGNPWKCECGTISEFKDGTSYSDHIKLIQKKYLNGKNDIL